MSRDIEIEAKTLINESDYNRLYSKYSTKYPPYSQTNYLFYDESVSLKDSRLALRIRIKKGKGEFTLKIDLDEGKLEINQQLSEQDLSHFLKEGKLPDGEVISEINKNKLANINHLKVFAILKTIRFDIKGDDYLLSIDKSDYLGTTDYEIECESSSMETATKYLKEFLEKESVPYLRNTKSKLKRVKEKLI